MVNERRNSENDVENDEKSVERDDRVLKNTTDRLLTRGAKLLEITYQGSLVGLVFTPIAIGLFNPILLVIGAGLCTVCTGVIFMLEFFKREEE